MTKTLSMMHSFLWGAPSLLLILMVGIWFTIRTRGAQLSLLPHALTGFCRSLRQDGRGQGISPFQALCTALGATAGTGNLVGVAGAICIGGPGAVFWMWICGVFGMITKCAEVTLAVRYRSRRGGEYLGGPMYMIRTAMSGRWHWLAGIYALLGMTASFGVGNATQINALVDAVNRVLPELSGSALFRRNLGIGLILAVLTGCCLLGGGKQIGKIAQLLVPFASGGYIALCLFALVYNAEGILPAFLSILQGAFSPASVTGGALGSGFLALRTGCCRGVFTNEAGMGTASIAHASAAAEHPVEQGLFGVVEVFLDTIVICTMTALVILTSGIPIPYGADIGGELTDAAFCAVFGSGASLFLAAALCCFGFATVLGWGLYGLRCSEYLFGSRGCELYALIQTLAVIPGAVLRAEPVWLFAEVLNGLMVIPNLTVLTVLAPEFFRLIIDYKMKTGFRASGGNYADFYQRKPL